MTKRDCGVVTLRYCVLCSVVTVGNYNLPSLDATGLDVIIIGGGDTGVDCIGTSLRQVHFISIT